jgi:hypothetical protein
LGAYVVHVEVEGGGRRRGPAGALLPRPAVSLVATPGRPTGSS